MIPELGTRPLTVRQAMQLAIRAVMAASGSGSPRPTERQRSKEVVTLRHAAIWVAAQLAPNASLTALGKAFGGLHHTTVRHALVRISSRANSEASALAAIALELAHSPAELAREEERVPEQRPSRRTLAIALHALLHACRQLEICAAKLLQNYAPQPEGTPTVPRQPEPTAHAPQEVSPTVISEGMRKAIDYQRADRLVCRWCGLRLGPHENTSQCISALRQLIAQFENELANRKNREAKSMLSPTA